jgi:hypothetical protein
MDHAKHKGMLGQGGRIAAMAKAAPMAKGGAPPKKSAPPPKKKATKKGKKRGKRDAGALSAFMGQRY